MIKNIITVVSIVLFLTLSEGNATAQQNSGRPFFYELHVASQGSFGPSESQAEIAGGTDTMYYDNKKHFSPGFRSCTLPEFVAGYCEGDFRLQGTFGYFVQDIGLVQDFSTNEYPFILADMFSVKVSALYRLAKSDKRAPFGFTTGFFIGCLIPVSYDMNDQTKADFGFNSIQHAVQLNWGVYYSYSILLSKKGLYAIAGATMTMPGTVGCVGKIEMQTDSPYSIIRDKIKMYSLEGFIGIGIHLKSDRKTNSFKSPSP
jgi:hypothetical protein